MVPTKEQCEVKNFLDQQSAGVHEKLVEKELQQVEEFKESLTKEPALTINPEDCRDEITVALRDKVSKQPLAYIINNLLTDEECDEEIRKAEEHTIGGPVILTLRTATRTNNYINENLSSLVMKRFPQSLLDDVEEQDGHPITFIHDNWRVVCYSPGESFPAHKDQGEVMLVKKGEDQLGKDFFYSTHTLLICLNNNFKGGATRFFPNDDYNHFIDIHMRKGSALLFRISPESVLHCGMPLKSSTKYVAQAAVMRKLPEGESHKPNAFRWGPGLRQELEQRFEEEIKLRQQQE